MFTQACAEACLLQASCCHVQMRGGNKATCLLDKHFALTSRAGWFKAALDLLMYELSLGCSYLQTQDPAALLLHQPASRLMCAHVCADIGPSSSHIIVYSHTSLSLCGADV